MRALALLLVLLGCASDPATVSDTAPDAGPETWTFVREDYAPVRGWILLDSDPEAVVASIETAARYGVNHIQLSHGLVMNIDELLGTDPATEARVATLVLGVETAHAHGMKAYLWAHEFGDPVGGVVCYEPGDPVWEARAQAYRDGLARVPGVDGVILMFGSAPTPPWFTVCTCDWCGDNYPEESPLARPPQAERLRLILENVGGVITNELGKELFVRTFVHEPGELAWHGEGLAAARGVEFTGMHKGPVQDWQPYNPHHPNMGAIGPHPSVMELDLAGEYYGLAELPFCAPGYYRYRMKHLWENRGIGVVARIQRGSRTALGTPNEINVHAIRALMDDIDTPLATIWEGFLDDFYGLAPGTQASALVRRVLESTFMVRTKSHYALGIWALDKGSDLSDSASLGQLHDRGDMPKWDPDWQPLWERLDRPDAELLEWLWQEGDEAVALADEALTLLPLVRESLDPGQSADLERRLWHQMHAARAWRDVDVAIWAHRALSQGGEDSVFRPWLAWVHEDLPVVAAQMRARGLADVGLASPARIERFLAATAGAVYAETPSVRPVPPLFSPLRLVAVHPDRALVSFALRRPAEVQLDYGLEAPDFAQTLALGPQAAGETVTVDLEGLAPGRRYLARLRAQEGERERRSGDLWIHTPDPCAGCPATECRDGRCETGCTPDCVGRCAGVPDGCGGRCETSDCQGCCDALGLCRSGTIWEACGEPGGACTTCPPGALCDEGRCQ